MLLVFQISESLQKVLKPAVAHDAINRTVTLPAAADNDLAEFHSMQYALFITCFIEVLGGLFFLLTALYIRRDKEDAEREAACKFL